MSKDKKLTEIVDTSKNLKNLVIGGGYVSMLQNTLFYILSQLEDPKDITKIYLKIETLLKDDKAEPLEGIEIHIYTLTSLIQYLKSEAIKQKAIIKYKGLESDDIKEGLNALLSQDYETFGKELEKLSGKITIVD
jgi:hypothetical protein